MLTPAAVVVMAYNDLQSAVIVMIALPLVPLFMVLIGLVTAGAFGGGAAGDDHAAVAGARPDRGHSHAARARPRRWARPAASPNSLPPIGVRRWPRCAIAFMSSLVLELLATLGVALVAVSVGLRLVFGELELSTALTALLLAPEVFWPLRRVGLEFHAAADGQTAAGQGLPTCSTYRDGPGARDRGRDRDVDPTDGVTVAGRDGMAPHDLTLRREPGSVTVLTGPNGSGKSTALEVILGLTPPSSGRVLIGGVDVATLDPRPGGATWPGCRSVRCWCRARCATNLELFGPLPDLDAACRATGFDEVLDGLPDGLDTVIGRDGTGLSLGQRQRLALTRVLGSPKPVLLLDEPTAHLDAALERRVLQAIVARADAGATVIVVAHREAVVAIGDHVVRIGGEALVPR